jgi:hypothetical protein
MIEFWHNYLSGSLSYFTGLVNPSFLHEHISVFCLDLNMKPKDVWFLTYPTGQITISRNVVFYEH